MNYASSTAPFDIRIDNARLVDGSGGPASTGSLGIREGRIAALGKIDGDAVRVIDAQGSILAPGFVDIHTHYDAQAFWDPTLSPSSHFGVTTVVSGNCGFSIAPLSGNEDDAAYLMRMLARVEGMPLEALKAGVPWDWVTFADFLNRLDGRTALNMGFMVGHSALRRAVMGARAVGNKADAQEIAAMQHLLRLSLQAGGMGFSSTISSTHNDADGNPVPSRFATREELLALAGVLKDFPGTTLEFLPVMSDVFPPEQLDLMTDLSKAANRPLNWNVLNPMSKRRDMYESHLGASDYARERGARVVPLVTAQVNTVWVNFISGFILDTYSGWDELFRQSIPERIKWLSDPERRRSIEPGTPGRPVPRRLPSRWDYWTIAEVFHPAYKRFQGKTIGEASKALGKPPFDAMCEIVVADELRTSLQMPHGGNDEATWKMRAEAWLDERTIVGASDAGAHLDMIDSFTAPVQVLAEGVRNRKLLTVEQAVRQLTSVPAGLIGLVDRGALKIGYHADLVIFDPDTVGAGPVHMRQDLPAGAGRLFADAVGVNNVLVGGCEIVRENEFLGKFPGRILRSGRDTRTVTP